MRVPTRRFWTTTVALAFLAAAAGPAAQAGEPKHYPSRQGEQAPPVASPPTVTPRPEFRVRLGLYQPTGDGGDFWQLEQDAFTGSVEDLEDLLLAMDFVLPLTRWTGVMFTLGYFDASERRVDKRFVDEFGNDIAFQSDLEMTPMTVAFVGYLTPPGSRVRPYLAAGGGLYWWEYAEGGDFVVDGEEIITTYYIDDGADFGWFAAAGLSIAVAPAWAIVLEGRWTGVALDVGGDFAPYGGDLDVSGWEATAGFSWSF